MHTFRSALFSIVLLAHGAAASLAHDQAIPTDEQGCFCLGYYYVAVLSFGLGLPTHVKALEPWSIVMSPYLGSREGQLAVHTATLPILRDLVMNGGSDGDVFLDRLAALIERHDAECAERMNAPRFDLSVVGIGPSSPSSEN